MLRFCVNDVDVDANACDSRESSASGTFPLAGAFAAGVFAADAFAVGAFAAGGSCGDGFNSIFSLAAGGSCIGGFNSLLSLLPDYPKFASPTAPSSAKLS